jgi:RHH-type transcriptional regulator, rel operon repressor / antitoxin RelB
MPSYYCLRLALFPVRSQIRKTGPSFARFFAGSEIPWSKWPASATFRAASSLRQKRPPVRRSDREAPRGGQATGEPAASLPRGVGADAAALEKLSSRPGTRKRKSDMGVWRTVYMSTGALSVRLPDDIKRRLEALAASTGRPVAFYVREAVAEHLAAIEYAYTLQAEAEAIRRREVPTCPLDEIAAELDLD